MASKSKPQVPADQQSIVRRATGNTPAATTAGRIPTFDASGLIIGDSGVSVTGLQSATATAQSTADANTASISTLSGNRALKAQTTQSEYVYIEAPSAKDYRIWLNIPRGRTVTSMTTITEAGTCTVQLKINTTLVTATANAASTSAQTQAQTAANVLAAGDSLKLAVSSVSGTCAGLTVEIQFSETLA